MLYKQVPEYDHTAKVANFFFVNEYLMQAVVPPDKIHVYPFVLNTRPHEPIILSQVRLLISRLFDAPGNTVAKDLSNNMYSVCKEFDLPDV